MNTVQTNLHKSIDLEKIKTVSKTKFVSHKVTDRLLKDRWLYIMENEHKRARESNSLTNSVLKYVNENYMDSNISISQIADLFNVHPHYLSTVFKSENNIGLLDYIYHLRVEKAKQIMDDERKMGIENIAAMVGFSNSKALGRAFKINTGINPSNYRSNLVINGEQK